MFSKLFGSLMISCFFISTGQAKLTPQQVSEKLKTTGDLSTTKSKKPVLKRADSTPVISKEMTTGNAPVIKKGKVGVPEKRKTVSKVKKAPNVAMPQVNVADTIKHKKRSPAVAPKKSSKTVKKD